MAARLACPASEIAHPVLSPNRDDVMCQISGRLQPAVGSPCTGCYTSCSIWRTAKDLEGRMGVRSSELRQRRPHVLGGGLQREVVRA